jgi:uncharacterized protein
MSNVQKVQSVYDAFGRGDIPAILALLADDVEWEYGMSNAGVPWLQPRRGRAEVQKFFESLNGLETTRFEPKTLLEGGNVVVALIDITAVVKATGRTISEEDETHIWHFGSDGLVKRFCHKVDTHQHWAAVHDK